jgi:ABC-type lipoprotein release transport system permease subunit
VYVSVACVLVVIVLVASCAPAIRAVRINPVDVVRGE